MLFNIFTLAVLATTTIASPVDTTSTTAAVPSSTGTPCVIIEGDNPFIIDYPRPACACKCFRDTCKSLTDGSREQIIKCVTTPWPTAANPWSNDLIINMGRCTGSIRCVG